MSKKNYADNLKKLLELQQKVEESRNQLATKIGLYVLQKNSDITELKQFKAFYQELLELKKVNVNFNDGNKYIYVDPKRG